MAPLDTIAPPSARRVTTSLTEGFALATPSGVLLGHTYRSSRDEAIATIFQTAAWPAQQRDGWSVEVVYARIFTPVYTVDVVPEEIVRAVETLGLPVQPAAPTLDKLDYSASRRRAGE